MLVSETRATHKFEQYRNSVLFRRRAILASPSFPVPSYGLGRYTTENLSISVVTVLAVSCPLRPPPLCSVKTCLYALHSAKSAAYMQGKNLFEEFEEIDQLRSTCLELEAALADGHLLGLGARGRGVVALKGALHRVEDHGRAAERSTRVRRRCTRRRRNAWLG